LIDENNQPTTELFVVFNTVMQNVDFNLGFHICRYKLNTFINQQTEFHSIFEGSIGTGVNIKIPNKNHNELELLRIRYLPSTNGNLQIIRDRVPSSSFTQLLDDKERRKEYKKDRHHTFLIFASGSVIMSSTGSEMKHTFHNLIDILLQNRKFFENIESKEGFTKKRKKKTTANSVP